MSKQLDRETSIMFFLGAGISRPCFPAGTTCADRMTERMLNGDWREISGAYLEQALPEGYPEDMNPVPRIQQFLGVLKNQVDPYYRRKRGREAHYEDLFSLCEELANEVTGTIDSPGVDAFVSELNREMRDVLSSRLTWESRNPSIGDVALAACDFIDWAKHGILTTQHEPLHVPALTQTVNGAGFRVDVCTLNHDLLLDELAGMDWNDGFTKPDGDLEWFDPAEYESEPKRPRLFKLHGSVNWRWYEEVTSQEGWSLMRVGRLHGDPPPHSHHRDEKGQEWRETFRLLLATGTSNLQLQYLLNIVWAEMWSRFTRLLDDHSTLVVSGYGWGYIPLNRRFSNWLWQRRDTRLHVFYRSGLDEFWPNMSGPDQRAVTEAQQRRQLFVHGKYIGDLAGRAELMKHVNLDCGCQRL